MTHKSCYKYPNGPWKIKVPNPCQTLNQRAVLNAHLITCYTGQMLSRGVLSKPLVSPLSYESVCAAGLARTGPWPLLFVLLQNSDTQEKQGREQWGQKRTKRKALRHVRPPCLLLRGRNPATDLQTPKPQALAQNSCQRNPIIYWSKQKLSQQFKLLLVLSRLNQNQLLTYASLAFSGRPFAGLCQDEL